MISGEELEPVNGSVSGFGATVVVVGGVVVVVVVEPCNVTGVGAITLVVAVACTGGPFVGVAVAVFGYLPALAAVVSLTMWTDAVSPGAMSPRAQVSTWLGADPVIEQVPGPE